MENSSTFGSVRGQHQNTFRDPFIPAKTAEKKAAFITYESRLFLIRLSSQSHIFLKPETQACSKTSVFPKAVELINSTTSL